ncbi:MAG: hypothetical protein IKD09_08260 [Lentisphaeria bacterium]|nr:hypothetical protein [Lentisphaeria bacterium]
MKNKIKNYCNRFEMIVIEYEQDTNLISHKLLEAKMLNLFKGLILKTDNFFNGRIIVNINSIPNFADEIAKIAKNLNYSYIWVKNADSENVDRIDLQTLQRTEAGSIYQFLNLTIAEKISTCQIRSGQTPEDVLETIFDGRCWKNLGMWGKSGCLIHAKRFDSLYSLLLENQELFK